MKTSTYFLVAGALALAACHEIPQTRQKPFAVKYEKQLYDGAPSADAEKRLDEALAARSRTQNEYPRLGDRPRQQEAAR